MGSPEFEALMAAIDGAAYAVDAAGTIVAVGRSNWDAFAAQHRGPPASHVVNRSLFSFLAGSEVQAAYRRMIEAVIGEGRQVVFEHRCDDPDTRRWMRMAVTRLRLGDQPPLALFQSVQLQSRQRPRMGLFEFAEGTRDAPIVKLCSICQRVQPIEPDRPGAWVAPEVYYRQGGSQDVQLSHGVCPRCYRRTRLAST